jgi:2-polyprenyl-3-methyl-5-hydroxy-6-metoxy-1,4-benzoquinol methylase
MDFFKHFSDHDTSIAIVHEFFDGKYTMDEVGYKLYNLVGDNKKCLRQGVHDLSLEWGASDRTSTVNVDNFYKTTDNYIFDLLPWNACGEFQNKIEPILELIESSQYNRILDFGGGIGFFSLVAADRFPDKEFVYSDFLNSQQAKFASFLIKKFNITNITCKDVQSIDIQTGERPYSFDLIVALDVLEHVSNLLDVIHRLTLLTYNIYQDSTFKTQKETPQHINTPTQLQFVNIMARLNFIPRNKTPKYLSHAYMEFNESGQLGIKFTK